MSKCNGPVGGTPPKKKTKEPEMESGETSSCVSCDKLIEDNGILCEFRYQWQHHECANISKDAYNILCDSPPNIMFFCTLCQPKITVAQRFF